MAVRLASVVAAALLTVALAGCTHQAEMGISYHNMTDGQESIRLAIMQGDREVYNNSADLAARQSVESGKVTLKSGPYRFAAWAGNLSAARDEDIGSSHMGVSVWRDGRGLEISISIV